jgi:hypothetical protein
MYKVWLNRIPVIFIGNTLVAVPVDYPDLVSKTELTQIINNEKGRGEVSFSRVKNG